MSKMKKILEEQRRMAGITEGMSFADAMAQAAKEAEEDDGDDAPQTKPSSNSGAKNRRSAGGSAPLSKINPVVPKATPKVHTPKTHTPKVHTPDPAKIQEPAEPAEPAKTETPSDSSPKLVKAKTVVSAPEVPSAPEVIAPKSKKEAEVKVAPSEEKPDTAILNKGDLDYHLGNVSSEKKQPEETKVIPGKGKQKKAGKRNSDYANMVATSELINHFLPLSKQESPQQQAHLYTLLTHRSNMAGHINGLAKSHAALAKHYEELGKTKLELDPKMPEEEAAKLASDHANAPALAAKHKERAAKMFTARDLHQSALENHPAYESWLENAKKFDADTKQRNNESVLAIKSLALVTEWVYSTLAQLNPARLEEDSALASAVHMLFESIEDTRRIHDRIMHHASSAKEHATDATIARKSGDKQTIGKHMYHAAIHFTHLANAHKDMIQALDSSIKDYESKGNHEAAQAAKQQQETHIIAGKRAINSAKDHKELARLSGVDTANINADLQNPFYKVPDKSTNKLVKKQDTATPKFPESGKKLAPRIIVRDMSDIPKRSGTKLRGSTGASPEIRKSAEELFGPSTSKPAGSDDAKAEAKKKFDALFKKEDVNTFSMIRRKN